MSDTANQAKPAAAPLSEAFGSTVLSDNPTPLSSALVWAVLSKRQTSSTRLS